MLYPQISFAAESKPHDPGCNVPRDYDCASIGYERPVTLDEAIEISKKETVVYLYGKGIQFADRAAHVMTQGKDAPAVPAVAVPGLGVPKNAFFVIIQGNVVRHKESGKPAEFYQRFINRGTIFVLTRRMYKKADSGN